MNTVTNNFLLKHAADLLQLMQSSDQLFVGSISIVVKDGNCIGIHVEDFSCGRDEHADQIRELLPKAKVTTLRNLILIEY